MTILVELFSPLLYQFMDIVLFHVTLGYLTTPNGNGLQPNTFSSQVVLYSQLGKARIDMNGLSHLERTSMLT